MHIEEVLIMLTQKSSQLTDENNRYVFKVQKKANKNQVKAAVEKMFDVKVTNIRTAVLPGKVKRAGRKFTKTPNWKKAYVQIQDGQKIELFKGI